MSDQPREIENRQLAKTPITDSPWLWFALFTAVGLAALLPSVSSTAALLLLMACGVAQLVWDVRATRDGLLPAWNARVRTVMTIGGTLCSAAMLLLKPT